MTNELLQDKIMFAEAEIQRLKTELKYEQISLAMACRHVWGLSKSGIGFKCVATDGPCPNKSQCPNHYAKFFRKQAKDV